MAQPFVASYQRGDTWFCVGAASTYPDLTRSGEDVLADHLLPNISGCQSSEAASSTQRNCKVFLAPEKGDRAGQVVQLSDDPKDQLDASLRRGDQVLIFQYKGRFHAVDNVRKSFATY